MKSIIILILLSAMVLTNPCWKIAYARGAGSKLQACPNGYTNENSLCYKPCPTASFIPIGPYCWNTTMSYSRGNYVVSWTACPADREKEGVLCYLKCKPGYTGSGQICRADNRSEERGVVKQWQCDDTEEQNGALCYPKCKKHYQGYGPICYADCPKGMQKCGEAMCTDSAKQCDKPIMDMIFGVVEVGEQIAEVAPGGTTLGVDLKTIAVDTTSGSMDQEGGFNYGRCPVAKGAFWPIAY